MNITRLVAPFVSLGLVEVVKVMHKDASQIKEDEKAHYIDHLFELGKPVCKWVTVIDGDEVWYPLDAKYADQLSKIHRGSMRLEDLKYLEGKGPQDDTSGIGNLVQILERLDEEDTKQKRNVTAYRWGWGEVDNEHRLLRGSETLLEAYPRVCYYNWHRKLWAKSDVLKSIKDHTANPVYGSMKLVDFEDSQHMFMIHYQMKSVEEYLLKIDQAFVEWKRSLIKAHRKCNSKDRRSYYDLKRAVGSPQPIPYASEYIRVVHSILERWPIDPSLAYLNTLASLTIPMGGTDQWELYMFFKWAVASGLSWNEELYLKRNPSVVLSERTFDDGLHHFLSTGFYAGARACFTSPQGKDFCVENATPKDANKTGK